MRTFHLRKVDGIWELKETGKKDALLHLKVYKNRAIITCKRELKKLATHDNPVSFRICNMKGEVRQEYTYPRSGDPRKSKG